MGRPRTKNTHLPKYVKPIHGSLWYCAPKQKAVRICPIGDDQALWKFMLNVTPPSGPVMYMSDLFDRYEREIIPTLAPRTQDDYKHHLKILREVFSAMVPDDVKPKDVGAMIAATQKKPTALKRAAVLSAVFGYAVGVWYVVDRNPCRDVKRHKSPPRSRYVTDAEYTAFYAMVPPRMKIAMDLALLTGQRQGDLLSLTWESVDTIGQPREKWAVRFKQAKTGKRMRVLVSPALEEVLQRARKLVPQLPRKYVLRTRKGDRYTSDGFRSIWQRFMVKAVEKKILKERFTFHDLRAKMVSDSATLEDAFALAGHTSMAMTRGVYDRGERAVKPLR